MVQQKHRFAREELRAVNGAMLVKKTVRLHLDAEESGATKKTEA